MIGGNIKAILQRKATTKNEIGESVSDWTDIQTLYGYLDLISGDSQYSTYYAKVEESTHLFIMDYVEITDKEIDTRLLINNEPYEITLIDNPMGLNKHIEIYLKYTGA